MNNQRRLLLKAGGGFLLLGIGGCGAPKPKPTPFEPKSAVAPDPVYCFDTVGHMPGSKPFIFGGTCLCTPSKELMATYHKDNHLLDMQLVDLLGEYERRGIQLKTREHQNCNNLCQWGPHLLKGGNCMIPPTPGTTNFEEIRYGIRYQKKPRLKKDGGKSMHEIEKP